MSKNIAKVVTRAIAKVSSNIIQKTKLSQDSSQLISVSNVDGDVHITDNKFKQQASINMQTLLNALSTEASQQSISQELAQEAKSVTSGLNLGQFSDATNDMNTLMEATINLLSTISQTCKGSTQQNQSIVVNRVKGSVFIHGNVFEQMLTILENCTEKAVADNKTLQNLSLKLSQTASAKSVGLSGWFLVAIIGIIVAAIVGGGYLGGSAILKFLFPLILIGGVVLIVLYFVLAKKNIKMVGFSTFIKNQAACLPKGMTQASKIYKNSAAASKACLDDPKCLAFDWAGITVDPKIGSYSILQNPTTQFYESVDSNCLNIIKSDNVKIFRRPTFTSGPSDPTLKNALNGDVYLNTTTGEWFQFNVGWQSKGIITNNKFTKISWNDGVTSGLPTFKGIENEIYIHANKHNPVYFHIYKYEDDAWHQKKKIKGPGLIPNTPKIINTSGFEEIERQKMYLYGGIAGIALGVIGTAVSFLYKSNGKD